jgi:hypothetical protein
MIKKGTAFSTLEKLRLLQRPSFLILQCVANGIDDYMRYDKYPDPIEFRMFVTETIHKNQEITEEHLQMLIEAAEQLLTVDFSHIDLKQLRTPPQSKPEQELPVDEIEFERVSKEIEKLICSSERFINIIFIRKKHNSGIILY